MKTYTTLLFFLVYSCAVQSQTVAELFTKADQFEKQLKEEDAYSTYKEIIKTEPRNVKALTMCSELASRIGKRQDDKAKSMDFYNAAKIYAQRALGADSTSPDANCAMAIAMGRMSMVSSGKEKVMNVREIKRYADIALKYDPRSFKAWHILGKWNYEVSNLNGLEKAFIKLLYGGMPSASIDDAIKYYEKSKSIEPTFILNLFELAKTYHKNGQDDKAIENINKLLRLPNRTAEDPWYKSESKKLLADLQ
ncbi:MAG: tetratricopeptide repeat protein [Sphingobacteriales bacterium]